MGSSPLFTAAYVMPSLVCGNKVEEYVGKMLVSRWPGKIGDVTGMYWNVPDANKPKNTTS